MLRHLPTRGDGAEGVEFIGVHSSREKAGSAAARLGRQPGISEAPDGFHVDEYRVDQGHWVEGYVTVAGARALDASGIMRPW